MNLSRDPCGRVLLFVVLRQAVRRGVPLGDALRSTAGETDVPSNVLAAMADEIDDGHPLSETIERRPRHFPVPLAALVAAGERSARLDETLDRCATFLRRRDRARSRLGAALVYPALCLACLGVVVAIFATLDPVGRFMSLGTTIPGREAGLLAPGAVRPLLVALLVAALATVAGLRRAPLPRDRIRLDLPLTGRLHRLAAAASFTRALAALLERGAPVDIAVEAALPCTGNTWVRDRLRRRLGAIRDGASLARALALPGVFPPSLTWRLAAGETRGAFAEALAAAADAYEDELDVRAGRLARLVEPAGLLAVGVVAAIVMRLIFAGLADLRSLGYFI